MLSSLVELNPGDGKFTRDVAQTLVDWGLVGHAYYLYLRVAEARPFEPQSYLALARCAEASGNGDLALTWYAVALQGEWDARFGEFKKIASFDALHFLRRVARGELELEMHALATEMAPEVVQRVGFDEASIAIAIEWNTDSTDVDLHVVEPSGEHCYYSHRNTRSGGSITRDVTQGYGPELYVLPNAPSGDYRVWVHYFAGNPNRTDVRSKVLATVYRDWGRPTEVALRREVTLTDGKQDQGIVTITIP